MTQQKYTRWGVYRNAADPRLLVPKRNPKFGWTINIAHHHATTALVSIAVLVAIGVAGSVVLARLG